MKRAKLLSKLQAHHPRNTYQRALRRVSSNPYRAKQDRCHQSEEDQSMRAQRIGKATNFDDQSKEITLRVQQAQGNKQRNKPKQGLRPARCLMYCVPHLRPFVCGVVSGVVSGLEDSIDQPAAEETTGHPVHACMRVRCAWTTLTALVMRCLQPTHRQCHTHMHTDTHTHTHVSVILGSTAALTYHCASACLRVRRCSKQHAKPSLTLAPTS